jgi:hypothetical protein
MRTMAFDRFELLFARIVATGWVQIRVSAAATAPAAARTTAAAPAVVAVVQVGHIVGRRNGATVLVQIEEDWAGRQWVWDTGGKQGAAWHGKLRYGSVCCVSGWHSVFGRVYPPARRRVRLPTMSRGPPGRDPKTTNPAETGYEEVTGT